MPTQSGRHGTRRGRDGRGPRIHPFFRPTTRSLTLSATKVFSPWAGKRIFTFLQRAEAADVGHGADAVFLVLHDHADREAGFGRVGDRRLDSVVFLGGR